MLPPKLNRARARAPSVIGLFVAVTLALFVFMHSGARGVAVCGDGGSTGPGTVSFWPLLTRCAGGFPESTTVKFDGGSVGVLLFVVWPALALVPCGARLVKRRRRGSGMARRL